MSRGLPRSKIATPAALIGDDRERIGNLRVLLAFLADRFSQFWRIFDSAICKRLMGNSNQRRGGGLALHFCLLGSG